MNLFEAYNQMHYQEPDEQECYQQTFEEEVNNRLEDIDETWRIIKNIGDLATLQEVNVEADQIIEDLLSWNRT